MNKKAFPERPINSVEQTYFDSGRGPLSLSKTVVARRVEIKGKGLLAAFLLGVGFCFVPTSVGEIVMRNSQ